MQRPTLRTAMIAAAIVSAFAAVAVATAAPSLLRKAGVDHYQNNILTKLQVWVDPDTECQYFVTDQAPHTAASGGGQPTGITPRLLPTGLPMCGPDQPLPVRP